jgi:hypothetical protein
LVVLPSWFWAKTISGLSVNDTAKSGFGLRMPGRTVNPAVMEAAKIIATSNTQRGTGLDKATRMHEIHRNQLMNHMSSQDTLQRGFRNFQNSFGA